MTLRCSLSIVVVFYIIVHVYTKEMDQKFVGSEALRQEANFYKLLEMSQQDNEHAEHLMNVKKSLDSNGKSLPSTVYKRMKMKVLKSLEADYLRRRALYDEQGEHYAHVKCGLRVIPVEVPYPTHGFSFPDFIDLHQCVGGCEFHAPSIIHCAAQATSLVHVQTLQVLLTTGNVEQKVETLQNHTQCGCQCVVQEHHCNNATETYDSDQCKCVCKDLTHTCNTKIKTWNFELCGCACIEPPYPCKSNDKLWSPDTCDCQCLDSIKKRCIRKNKLLNKDTCDCYCSPDIVCPAGSELNSYDCSCVLVA